ncbi:MAG: hypothetical protein AAGB02_03785 [Pseudomonadota bacterium]
MSNEPRKLSAEATQHLIKLAIIEGVLITGVIAVYFMSNSLPLLIGGLIASTLVTTPLVLRLVKSVGDD